MGQCTADHLWRVEKKKPFLQHFLVAGFPYSYHNMILSNTVLLAFLTLASGSALKPANKSSTSWACPEYGWDFVGADITAYADIMSWQECGRICHEHKTCSHWTWTIPNYPRPENERNVCLLKNGEGSGHFSGAGISGQEWCVSCENI